MWKSPGARLCLFIGILGLAAAIGRDLGAVLLHSLWGMILGAVLLPLAVLAAAVVYLSSALKGFD